ncbi:hypothetical protein L1049_027943 [Liquidambar formosana]|uniref:Uncharacterized protein n=1 Tax=Liquidambar formosana TaxID=63359 RepID=A0AAP0WVX9_LIQFO
MGSRTKNSSWGNSESDSLLKKKKRGMEIEGYPVEGLSIGGHETCVIFPSLKLVFDIGRCPDRAISQDVLFISHGHMDHIITYTVTMPEIAFTGDTMSDFIVDDTNDDVLRARILVMESTYVDNAMTVENARDYGHTHLSEIVSYADKFENKAILLIHFSARYKEEEIQEAVSALPPPLAGRVFALTEGF